jgi:hypothetical protein
MSQRPAIPPPPYEGGCLCGAVRYRVNAQPMAINACHCRDCRKLTGAANLLMVAVPRDAFHQMSGAVDRFRKRADSGRDVDLVRCAECGTRLWHEPLASPALLFFAAGTLDDPDWAVPTSHIWIEKAAPGTHFHSDAIQVQGQPATRDVLFDAFRAVYANRKSRLSQ